MMRSLALLFLLTACEGPGPATMDSPEPTPAMTPTVSDPNTFGCDMRSVAPNTDYCQDTTTTDPGVRALYESACTQNKGTIMPGGCPHFTLGACRSTGQAGPAEVTITNWFVTYPGISTSAQLAALCGASYVAP